MLHIDLGGMNFNFVDISHIFEKGLAKSRTLRACHFIGVNNFGVKKYKELLNFLKIRDTNKDDFCSKLDRALLAEIFVKKKTVQDSSVFFADGLKKNLTKNKLKAMEAISSPLFPVAQEERHIF